MTFAEHAVRHMKVKVGVVIIGLLEYRNIGLKLISPPFRKGGVHFAEYAVRHMMVKVGVVIIIRISKLFLLTLHSIINSKIN